MSGSLLFLLVLRLVHILGGIFWVGTLVFLAAFLGPSIIAAGPGGGAVMRQLVGIRRMSLYLMGAMILTILSGILLYIGDASGSNGAWARSRSGFTFGIGGAAAIIAGGVGVSLNMPASKRLAALGQTIQAAGGPPSAEQAREMAALQARLGRLTQIVTGLAGFAAAAMAVARYL